MVRQRPAKPLSPVRIWVPPFNFYYCYLGEIMGKIFGISDNPVSTIESALRPLTYKKVKDYGKPVNTFTTQADKFVSKEKRSNPNAFIKMRNGIGRLMSHFSKVSKK